MKASHRWNRFPAVASLVLAAALLMGADKSGCGPIDTPPVTQNQCAADTDCNGLPHVMCLGAWACTQGACSWKCNLPEPECATAADCAGGTPTAGCVTGAWTCASGTCAYQCNDVVACTVDADCKAGDHCAQVSKCPACRQATPPCEAPCVITHECGPVASTKCSTDTDCPSGWFCGQLPCPAPPDPVPVDYCHATCMKQETTTGCQADTDCPKGQTCVWPSGCANCTCPAGATCNCPMCPAATQGTCQATTPTCSTDVPCPVGQVCTNGACVDVTPPPACTTDSDCLKGQACTNGACVDVTPPPACTTDTDCLAGLACVNSECVTVTPTECSTDKDCPTDQVCVETTVCPACVNATPPCKVMCSLSHVCQAPACHIGEMGTLCTVTDANGNTCTGSNQCTNGQWVCTPGPGGCLCDPATNAGCLAAGKCWLDTDCTLGWHCVGAFQCPAGAMCLVADHPGTCEPYAGDRPCASSTDCLKGEVCPMNSQSLQCCPNGAPCAYGIPTCICQLDVGACWSSGDCATGSHCEGAVVCPPNAMCLVADHAGKCVADVQPSTCKSDGDCGIGDYCKLTCAMAGCEGTCTAVPSGECIQDADCATGQTCVKGICPMCIPCPCFGKCAAK